jgi:preprotein translocase subunit SecY
VFNMFSGGALERFSILALGVMPVHLGIHRGADPGHRCPALQALKKEGEAGRRTLTNYTRWGTVGLAIFQGFGVASRCRPRAGVVVISPAQVSASW